MTRTKTDALAIVPDDQALMLRELADEAHAALAIITTPGWSITSDEQSSTVGSLLVQVKAKIKRADEARKFLVAPALEQQRRINAFFAQGLEPLQRLEAIMKSGLSRYVQAVDAARREAMLASAPVPAPAADVAGITYRTTRSFRVIDPDKVPRAFCSPDLAKIRDAGTEEIAGVEFYDVQTPVVRTGKA